MNLASELTYGLSALIADQGGTITYRKVTTLPGPNPAPNPPTYIALVVAGATLAGSGSINMRVDPTQGGVFTGRLIAHDTFLITGDPTVYTVSGQVVSPSTADTLTAVPFTPNLAHNAADGAAVTLSFAADSNLQALITDYPSRLINGTTIQAKDHQVRFLASAFTAADPIAGDIVILPGGEQGSVIDVSHMESQGVHYGWNLHVRA